MRRIDLNWLLFFLTLTAIFALFFAYSAQYFFALQPCHLCLYERQPYFAIIIICAFTLSFFGNKNFKKIALFLCLLLLTINFSLSLYHVGVEQKIFKIQESCVSQNSADYGSIEELKIALLKEQAIRCDQPTKIFGISMALLNAIYCFSIFSFAISLYQRSKQFMAQTH